MTSFVDDDELVYELKTLIDRQAPPAADTVDVRGSANVDAAQWKLKQYFKGSTASAVNVGVGTRTVGVVTRETLGIAEGTAAEVGAGERSEPLGDSTRYRLLRFECRKCKEVAHRVYFDPRDLPQCSHGPMELHR